MINFKKNFVTCHILTLLILISSSFTNSESNKNSLYWLELNGKVKSIESNCYIYSPSDANQIKTGDYSYDFYNGIIVFNSKGNTTSWLHKDSKGNIEYSEEYTYDSQNNNILINKYDSTKKLTGYNKFVFKNQLCVSSSSKDENGSREVIHSYNENRIAKTYSATSYDNFGKITKKEINTYEYYPNSKLIHTQIEKSQDYIENKTSERVITLDTLGRMIKDNHQNGNVEELLYSGKNKGCDKIYWYTDGILITTTSYKYDDNENIISRNDKWSADNSTSNEYFEYEYDLNRNWTKRIHTTSYGIKKITLRTIIYY